MPKLQIDCEESTVDTRPGEPITWRITIRNSGAAAHGVSVVVFFAEGIEPISASGAGHRLAVGEVRFGPIGEIGADDAVQLVVSGKGVQPGAVAYRVEAGCREVPGKVAHEAIILVRSPSGR